VPNRALRAARDRYPVLLVAPIDLPIRRAVRGQDAHVAHGPAGGVQLLEGLVQGRISWYRGLGGVAAAPGPTGRPVRRAGQAAGTAPRPSGPGPPLPGGGADHGAVAAPRDSGAACPGHAG